MPTAVGPCDCKACPTGIPAEFAVDMGAVVDVTCSDCDLLGGSYVLVAVPADCGRWTTSFPARCGMTTLRLLAILQSDGSVNFLLEMFGPPNATYALNGQSDCASAITLTRTSSATLAGCSWPATVQASPVGLSLSGLSAASVACFTTMTGGCPPGSSLAAPQFPFLGHIPEPQAAGATCQAGGPPTFPSMFPLTNECRPAEPASCGCAPPS